MKNIPFPLKKIIQHKSLCFLLKGIFASTRLWYFENGKKDFRLISCFFLYIATNKLEQKGHAYFQGIGIGGVGHNKGGVAIRLNLHQTSLCFVGAHFTAHTDKTESRYQRGSYPVPKTIFTLDSTTQYKLIWHSLLFQKQGFWRSFSSYGI